MFPIFSYSSVNDVRWTITIVTNDTIPDHRQVRALKWSERLVILIDIAKAVQFLHTGVIPGFFNNRLRTNNILLDEHRRAKLGDYGLSIINDDDEFGVSSFYIV